MTVKFYLPQIFTDFPLISPCFDATSRHVCIDNCKRRLYSKFVHGVPYIPERLIRVSNRLGLAFWVWICELSHPNPFVCRNYLMTVVAKR